MISLKRRGRRISELLRKWRQVISKVRTEGLLGNCTFYHITGSRTSSQELAAEKRKIDIQAKSFVILAAAIEKTSEWSKPSPNHQRIESTGARVGGP